MATWVRTLTTGPTALDSDLTGPTGALSNATAPSDFDPDAVSSVRLQWTNGYVSGTFGGDSWDSNGAASFGYSGTILAEVAAGATDIINTNGESFTYDETDSTIPTGSTVAQWESAVMSHTTGEAAFAHFSQDKGKDGVTVGVTNITVTITYTPGSANYDETGRAITVTSTITSSDQMDQDELLTAVAITSTVAVTDTYTTTEITIIGTPQTAATSNGGNAVATFDVTPAENDIVLVIGGVGTTGAVAPGIVTSGYTNESIQDDVSSWSIHYGVWWKKMGASPDTSVTVKGTGTAQDATAYVVFVLRNVDGTTPIDTATQYGTTSITANPDPPSITTTANLSWVFAATVFSGSPSVSSQPSGYPTEYRATGVDTNRVNTAVTYLQIDTAGAENPGTWTLSSSTPSNGISVAVRLAADTGPTFDETGRAISVTSTVTLIEAYTATDDKSIVITSTDTVADQMDMDELALATTIASTVTVTDAFNTAEALAETITSTITVTDDLSFGESFAITVASTIAVTDTSAMDETLAETVTSTVTLIEALTLLESLAETIASTIVLTDSHGFYDLLLAETITSTIALTDQADMVETLAVTITSTDTLTDTTDMDELTLATTITSTIVLTDVYTPLGGTNFDETGRAITITSTITAPDAYNTAEAFAVTITSTVTSADGWFFDETGRAITITSTEELWDRVELWEAHAEPYGHFRQQENQGNSYLYWNAWDPQYSTPDALDETLEIRLEFELTGGIPVDTEFPLMYENTVTGTDKGYKLAFKHTSTSANQVYFRWSEDGTNIDKVLSSSAFALEPVGSRLQLRLVFTATDGTNSKLLTEYKINSSDDITNNTGWTTVNTATGATSTMHKQTSDIGTLGREDWGGGSTGIRWYQWYWNGPTGGPMQVDWRTWPHVKDNAWYFSDGGPEDYSWTINPYVSSALKTQRYHGNHLDNHRALTATSTVTLATEDFSFGESPSITIASTVTVTDVYHGNYDETGRQIEIVSTVASSDTVAAADVLSETLSATVTAFDAFNTSDTLNVTVACTVTLTDLLTVDELLHQIGVTSTIATADVAGFVDILTFTINGTVIPIDRSDMTEPADSVTIISFINSYDFYYPVGWTPPERGKHMNRHWRATSNGVRTDGRLSRG